MDLQGRKISPSPGYENQELQVTGDIYYFICNADHRFAGHQHLSFDQVMGFAAGGR